MIDAKRLRRYRCRACGAISNNLKWQDWFRGETWVLFCPRCETWDTEEINPNPALDKDLITLLAVILFTVYLCFGG
jgi:hypothetical protein